MLKFCTFLSLLFSLSMAQAAPKAGSKAAPKAAATPAPVAPVDSPAVPAPETAPAPPAPAAALPAAPKRPKLVLAILVDQMRYDYLERFHELFVEDGFKRLTDRGAFLTFARYNYFPTITGPGHASFFSGSPPAMHGIIANDWFDRASGKMMYCVGDKTVESVGTTGKAGQMSPRNFIGANFSDMMRLHYQSKVVGISMKDRGAILPAGRMPAGAYWFEGTTGNFITSSYYRPQLPDWVQKFNDRGLPREYMGRTWERLLPPEKYPYPDDAAGESVLPGEKTSTFPHTVVEMRTESFENIIPTPFGNALLAQFARAAVEGENLGQGPQPDVLTVSFSSIDYNGHRFGPYSQEVQDLVLRLDRELAAFFKYLDDRLGAENYVTVFTADHGVAPTPEFAQQQGFDGSRLDPIETMTELSAKLNERFGVGKYLLYPHQVEGGIFFNYEVLAQKRISLATICDFTRDWAYASGRFQACYTREQILKGQATGLIGERVTNGYNGERSGDVVFINKPYTISWANASGTTHGSPYSYDAHIPVLFQGPLFKPGRYADEFYITDIVPTLCAAMHIDEPPMSIGKPLVKVLAEQP